MILLILLMFVGCATVNIMQDNWEYMNPKKVVIEKLIVGVSAAAIIGWGSYIIYDTATTRPFTRDLLD